MLFKRPKSPGLKARIRQALWPRGGWRRASLYVCKRVMRLSASPHVIAVGFASGVFVSFTPFIGFHLLFAAFVAMSLGGNILASAIGTFVGGSPLTFPFIWAITYKLGAFALTGELSRTAVPDLPHNVIDHIVHNPVYLWRELLGAFGPALAQMTIGAGILGAPAAAASYFLVRDSVMAYQKRRRARLKKRRQGLSKTIMKGSGS